MKLVRKNDKIGNEMTCPNCKTSNDHGALFCRECGTTLIDVREVSETEVDSLKARVPSQDVDGSPGKSDDRDALIGVTLDGRYQIGSIVGTGGMGTVYRCTRLLIGDEAAIKILHHDKANVAQFAERFRREAQTAARLKHPNAVSVYDFGVTSQGIFYLVMELVDGQSVRNIIKQKGPFTPAAAAEVITQVCAALDEAHRQNIIHRDIKSENIMVHQVRGGLDVRVLDFGIAKLRDQTSSNLTQTGSVMGTPHYMSPEQCIGEELDSRSDIYSLGVVLYEMLSGVVPFRSPTSTAVVIQHVNQPPPSLRAINMSISPAVEAVVMHALEKRREARPQTAGTLARELIASLNMIYTAQPVLPTNVNTSPIIPSTSFNPFSGEMPTMVTPASQGSGNYAAIPTGANRYASGTVPITKKGSTFNIVLAVVALVFIGVVISYFIFSPKKSKVVMPDHFGIFIRSTASLSELRRGEYRDVMQARSAMMADSSLPKVDAKPVFILYSEAQDIPVSDLKLLQLDSVDASGRVSYWNYQVAPVDGHPGMKLLRVASGLANGKYSFALVNGFMDDGNHKFWPFEVNGDAVVSTDVPQIATIPLKPKPVATPNAVAQAPVRPPVPPLPLPTGAVIAYCTANNVVLRSYPGLNGPKIGSLSSGQRLYVLQLSSNYDTWRGITANWAYVQPENSAVRGWVFTHFVRR